MEVSPVYTMVVIVSRSSVGAHFESKTLRAGNEHPWKRELYFKAK